MEELQHIVDEVESRIGRELTCAVSGSQLVIMTFGGSGESVRITKESELKWLVERIAPLPFMSDRPEQVLVERELEWLPQVIEHAVAWIAESIHAEMSEADEFGY